VSEELLYRLENRVALITLNRPERLNALTKDMMQALRATLAECAVDEAVGCVVVTGAGRAFCAGGDVQVQAKTAATGSKETPERRTDLLRSSMEASRLLHEMPKPTIAMLNGVAAGAGLSLALACDLRYAAEGAFLTTAFARVGFAGDYGGTWFLTQLVGPALARELYFFADRVDAAEALRLGLVNAVFPADRLEDEVLARARRLASGPRLAHAYMKENLNRALTGTLEDALDLEATHHLHTGTTEDHREAATAFVEKREPVFRGR
jgi:2-(1,2-epoxy-1,2-dihydrophenyl)acetyl-CoA isomerase